MSSWVFVDLKDFTDKLAPVFEKLSLFATQVKSEDFLKREKPVGREIVFFNGNSDISILKKMLETLKESDLCYLVVDSVNLSNQAEGELNRFLLNINRVRGVFDANQGAGFLISQLSGIKEIADLAFEVDSDKEYFDDFDEQLGQLTKHLSTQLQRIKKIHEAVVPQRSISFGPFQLTCKYAAGESSHSEFWDAIKNNNQLVTFLLSAQSSSDLTLVLDKILNFFSKPSFDKRDLKIIHSEIKEKISDFSLFVMLCQLNDEKAHVIIDGPQLVYINGKEVMPPDQAKLSKIEFSQNDKLIVLSKGLMLNFEEEYRLDELEGLLKRNWKEKNSNFLNDVFFKSKINQSGKFHHNDASALVFDVIGDKND